MADGGQWRKYGKTQQDSYCLWTSARITINKGKNHLLITTTKN
jgi:hypothetical protein